MKTVVIQTTQEFTDIIKEYPVVVVDFYKDNCPGCRMLDVTLSKLESEPLFAGAVLIKAKLETLGEEWFKEQGLRQTPTSDVYIYGERVERIAGFAPPSRFVNVIISN